MNQLLQEAIQSVEYAEHAVMEAQAMNDSNRIQHAHIHLTEVGHLVNELKSQDLNEEEQKKLLHVSERLKHLLETQSAIQTYK